MTTASPAHERFAVLGLVALLCLLLVYGAWYPGVFTLDERDILGQALNGQLHDGHSPLLVKFWSLTQLVKAGPAIPYLAGLVLAILMAALLLRQVLGSALAAAAGLCCVVLLPPVFVSLGLVTKDLFFVGAMLAVMYGVARYDAAPRRRYLAFALASAQLAVMFRIDAVFALVPVLFYLAWQVVRRRHPGWLRALLLAGGCTVLLVLALVTVSKLSAKHVFRAKAYHAEQVSMLFDLSAMSIGSDRMLIPASRLGPEGFPLPMLRARFKTGSADAIIWSTDAHHLVYRPDADHAELHRAWFRAILADPLEYLRFRTEYAAHFIGIRYNEDWLRGQFSGDESMVRESAAVWERARSPMQGWYRWLSESPSLQVVYLPWFWLLCGVFPLLVFGLPLRAAGSPSGSSPVPTLLIASALSYTLLMSILSAAAIGRYHSWPRMAIGVAIVLAAAELLRWRRRTAAPAAG